MYAYDIIEVFYVHETPWRRFFAGPKETVKKKKKGLLIALLVIIVAAVQPFQINGFIQLD